MNGLEESAAYSAVHAKALRLLTVRARSEGELRARLGATADAEVVDAVIAALLRVGLLNDAQLADALGRRAEREGRGPRWIEATAARRVVPSTMIFASYDADRALDAVVEKFAMRWGRSGKFQADAEARRLAAAVVRRGFSFQDARTVLRRLGHQRSFDSAD